MRDFMASYVVDHSQGPQGSAAPPSATPQTATEGDSGGSDQDKAAAIDAILSTLASYGSDPSEDPSEDEGDSFDAVAGVTVRHFTARGAR
jgi:hypothetical protein